MLADDRLPIVIPLAFIAVPLVIVAVGIALFVNARRVSKRVANAPAGWLRAPGLVTDERTWFARRGTTASPQQVFVRQPIVTYRASSGHDVTFTSTITGTFMPKPGSAVVVCHDPADPARARIAPESIPRVAKVVPVLMTVLVFLFGVPLVAALVLVGVFLLHVR